MEYDFVLKFKLANGGADVDALLKRLGKVGCDDAVVGIGLPGRIALEFTRGANSASRVVLMLNHARAFQRPSMKAALLCGQVHLKDVAESA